MQYSIVQTCRTLLGLRRTGSARFFFIKNRKVPLYVLSEVEASNVARVQVQDLQLLAHAPGCSAFCRHASFYVLLLPATARVEAFIRAAF